METVTMLIFLHKGRLLPLQLAPYIGKPLCLQLQSRTSPPPPDSGQLPAKLQPRVAKPTGLINLEGKALRNPSIGPLLILDGSS